MDTADDISPADTADASAEHASSWQTVLVRVAFGPEAAARAAAGPGPGGAAGSELDGQSGGQPPRWPQLRAGRRAGLAVVDTEHRLDAAGAVASRRRRIAEVLTGIDSTISTTISPRCSTARPGSSRTPIRRPASSLEILATHRAATHGVSVDSA